MIYFGYWKKKQNKTKQKKQADTLTTVIGALLSKPS